MTTGHPTPTEANHENNPCGSRIPELVSGFGSCDGSLDGLSLIGLRVSVQSCDEVLASSAGLFAVTVRFKGAVAKAVADTHEFVDLTTFALGADRLTVGIGIVFVVTTPTASIIRSSFVEQVLNHGAIHG